MAGETRTASPPAISQSATPRPLMMVGKISLAYCRQMKKAAVMLSLPSRPDTNLSEEKSWSESGMIYFEYFVIFTSQISP